MDRIERLKDLIPKLKANKKIHLLKIESLEWELKFLESEKKQLTLTDVRKSLPTKEEINLAANECSDINGIICEDEYWVIAKNDGFKEGADFVINKLK